MTDIDYDDDPDDFQRGLYGPEWVHWHPSDPLVHAGPAAPLPLDQWGGATPPQILESEIRQ